MERYARGERSAASRLLGDLDPRHLSTEARDFAGRIRLLSDQARRDGLLKAAVLLHTDAALARRAAGDPPGTDAQLELALVHAAVVDSFPGDPDLQGFIRRWYLAAALDRHRFLETEGALALLDQGLRRFPEDPELHLARGSVEETRGTWPVLRRAPEARVSRSSTVWPGREAGTAVSEEAGIGPAESKVSLREAEKEFRAALAKDATLLEARLRRGRVLFLLGQTAEAKAEIDAVLRADLGSADRYLALLFQGRLQEGEPDFASAARSYRGATALFPEARAARMALGHALDHLGDKAASRSELRLAVEEGNALFERPDPWAAYAYGQSSRADSLLAALRDEMPR